MAETFNDRFDRSISGLCRGTSRLQAVLTLDRMLCQYIYNETTRGEAPSALLFFMTMERTQLEYLNHFPALEDYLSDLSASSLDGQVYNLPLLLTLSHLSHWTHYDNTPVLVKLIRHYVENYRPMVWTVLKDQLGLTIESKSVPVALPS